MKVIGLATFFFPAYSTALLVVVYGKIEKDVLSETDCKAIRQIIRLIEEELMRGETDEEAGTYSAGAEIVGALTEFYEVLKEGGCRACHRTLYSPRRRVGSGTQNLHGGGRQGGSTHARFEPGSLRTFPRGGRAPSVAGRTEARLLQDGLSVSRRD